MLDAILTDFTPPTLALVLLGTALIVVLVPILVSQISHPRALGTRVRDDLWTPSGSLPFVGHQLRVLKSLDRQPELVVEMLEERRKAGIKDASMAASSTMPFGKRFICLTQPQELEHMQKTNFKNYEKGPQQRAVMGQVLGHGIFTSDGDLWNIQRKATSKIFNNNAFRGHHLGFAAKNEEVNLSKLFFSLTLDGFCEMSFSTKPGALLAEKDGAVHSSGGTFAAAFDSCQTTMSRRFSQPFWPITEILDGTSSRMKAATAIVHSYANDMIRQRREEFDAKAANGEVDESDEQEGKAPNDLLTMFLRVRDEKGEGLSSEMLRDATINLLIAGRDTTAGTLAWCCFHLLSNPHLVEGIRHEAAALGTEDAKLEYDQLKDVGWTMACFYEAARLHPSVPVNFWHALGDDKLPNGPRIEKGDYLQWSDWASGRDPQLWGKDAGLYKPSRWIDEETGKFRPASEYRMHAFNGGRRRCLGEGLAVFEGCSVLLALFHHFDVAFAPDYLATTEMLKTERCGVETPRYQNALTLPMLQPLRVTATRRIPSDKADLA
ncbi:hypothetical protein JCM8097_004947 [Rhodosporidiobolus ruineniae]